MIIIKIWPRYDEFSFCARKESHCCVYCVIIVHCSKSIYQRLVKCLCVQYNNSNIIQSAPGFSKFHSCSDQRSQLETTFNPIVWFWLARWVGYVGCESQNDHLKYFLWAEQCHTLFIKGKRAQKNYFLLFKVVEVKIFLNNFSRVSYLYNLLPAFSQNIC